SPRSARGRARDRRVSSAPGALQSLHRLAAVVVAARARALVQAERLRLVGGLPAVARLDEVADPAARRREAGVARPLVQRRRLDLVDGDAAAVLVRVPQVAAGGDGSELAALPVERGGLRRVLREAAGAVR